jgi:hypothetical protein
MAQFYWVGSTGSASSGLNPFNWAHLGNWRTLKQGNPGSTAPGGTLASLIPATRLPMSTASDPDTVNFGSFPQSTTPYSIGSFHVYSPCLFGGVSTGTDRTWTGTTAGSSVRAKYGTVVTIIHPSYPFSKLGGYVDLETLNGWVNYLNTYYPTSAGGARYPEFTLASGTEYDDAQYTASFVGGTAWGMGNTYSISFANQSSYDLRLRGMVQNQATNRTTVKCTGFTGATAGATGAAYDGTANVISFYTSLVGQSQINAFLPAAQRYTLNPVGSAVYNTSDTTVSGNWNRIVTNEAVGAPHNFNLTLSSVKCNALVLKVDRQNIVSTPVGGVSSGVSVSQPSQSVSDFGGLYADVDTSLRYLNIQNWRSLAPDKQIVIHADITSAGGFACASPAGPSAGPSGGVLVPNGSLELYPMFQGTDNQTIVNIGFPGYDGSTKANTTINNVYVQSGQGVDYTVNVDGPITVTNMYMSTGTLKKTELLQPNALMRVDNLSLSGDAVVDFTENSTHDNIVMNITANSNSTTFKPGASTTLNVGHLASS